MKFINISKEFLEEEYISKGKTYETISKELGCSKDTVMSRAKTYGIKSRNSGYPKAKLDGKVFGSLEVLREVNDIGKHVRWLCKCSCGNEIIVTSTSLIRGQKSCWDCRNKTISNKKWKGHGEISGDHWSKIIRGAKQRNFEIEITIKEAWEIFIFQNRKCALSGKELVFSRNTKGNTTASLDRIDSLKGYIQGNIQWVHKDINQMKWDFDNTYFIKTCIEIAETHKGIDDHLEVLRYLEK